MNPTTSSIKVVSFDFDGVFIRDSDAVFKKDAWKIAFASYEGKYELHLKVANGLHGWGKPGGRKEIMQYVFKKINAPTDSIDNLVETAAKIFDNYVQNKILEAGLVPGAVEALNELSTRDLSLYLNSGTATPALILSAKNLKIDHFFKEILGSTKEPVGGSKVDNLLHIAEREGKNPYEIMVAGDGESDIHAAKELGCKFIGVANCWNRWKEEGKQFPLVTDLKEISKFL